MGCARAGDPAVRARHRRRADRGGDRGIFKCDPAVSDGGGADAAAARSGYAVARSSAADALHLGEHVGGIAAPIAGDAARAAPGVLQWPIGRLHGHSHDFWLRRLLSRGRPAATVSGYAAVPNADVIFDFDRAQLPANVGPAGTGVGPHARPAADLLAYRPRSDVDRRGRRFAGLRRSPFAPDRRMNAVMNSATADLWPYLLLVLAGYLPNEIWRVLGLVLARGLNEDSEIVEWSRAVATAIIAGVIAKLILFSSGALAGIPLTVRVTAAVCGFLAFLAVKRSVFAGVAAGEAV